MVPSVALGAAELCVCHHYTVLLVGPQAALSGSLNTFIDHPDIPLTPLLKTDPLSDLAHREIPQTKLQLK